MYVKKKGPAGLVCVLFLFVIAVSFTLADSGKPAAVISDPVHRFDPVVEGKHVIHEFTIRNQGDAPLRILKTESG